MTSKIEQRVLITGASGFVGRALSRLLSEEPGLGLSLASRHPAEGAHTTVCDLLDAHAVRDLVRAHGFDHIYHLVGSFADDYEAAYDANVRTAKNILDAVAAENVKARVLLVGSAAEYGIVSPEHNPIPESHPLHPVSIYGFTKMLQTRLADFYHRRYGLDIVVARVFNLLGSGISKQLFPGRVADQIERYRRGEVSRITIGNLEAIRDYLDVGDAAKKLRLVMERGERGGVYNVGSGIGTPIKDILERLLRAAGLDMSIVESTALGRQGRGDVSVIYADIKNLQALEQKFP